MTTTSVPAPEAPAAISPLGRIAGIFFSPKKTLEDIVRKPSWIVPAVVLTLISVGLAVAINQRIDWLEFIGHQIEQSSRASQLSAEQKEQQIASGAKIAPIFTYVIGIPAPLLFMLIVALVMMGAYNLLAGANVNYSTSLGIVSHAQLVTIMSSLIFVLVLFLRPPGTLDLENPIATNPGVFLPDGSAKWLVKLCTSLDLFSFWILILLAIGFAATNPKKLKGGKAFTIAFTVWAAWVVLRVGWAAIFS